MAEEFPWLIGGFSREGRYQSVGAQDAEVAGPRLVQCRFGRLTRRTRPSVTGTAARVSASTGSVVSDVHCDRLGARRCFRGSACRSDGDLLPWWSVPSRR